MVNLKERQVVIVLSNKGKRVLHDAAITLPDSPTVVFYVQEGDEHGLWVWFRREDGDRLLLIRWEFILALEVPLGEVRVEGLVH
jgi:hypothetical protein